ncbi:MAG: putative heme transporter, partial [Actinomycetota bacterium]|nr:putative heme transporter [Actinomycetota bacterium]
ATTNWLLDAASLWVLVWAFGFRVGLDGLIVAYGLANVLAAVPITPGGLGVVEAVLTSSLVGFGAPRGVAILGVITYRLLNFWLPIPLGGIASVSLRFRPGEPRRGQAEILRLAEASYANKEDARRWAERHGLKVQGGEAETPGDN